MVDSPVQRAAEQSGTCLQKPLLVVRSPWWKLATSLRSIFRVAASSCWSRTRCSNNGVSAGRHQSLSRAPDISPAMPPLSAERIKERCYPCSSAELLEDSSLCGFRAGELVAIEGERVY